MTANHTVRKVIKHTVWWCGDYECDCQQLQITDESARGFLATGAYTCLGEPFDYTEAAQVMIKFMRDNLDCVHKLDEASVKVLEEILEKAQRYDDLSH